MGYGISVAPNAGDVYAKVKGKTVIGNLGIVKLFVLEAKDYNKMPNFVKDKIGKEIEITVSKNDLTFFEKENVNILVSLTGDEKQHSYTARIKPKLV